MDDAGKEREGGKGVERGGEGERWRKRGSLDGLYMLLVLAVDLNLYLL